VTLIVGKEKKAYNLHKDLLCFYSDYFRAAFNGSFKEAADRKLELPNVEISLFDKFQVWLYTRDLQEPTGPGGGFHFLVDMWILGDQHQIPLLQNQVMDEIFAKLAQSNSFTVNVVPKAYAKTVAGSPLRKAVIEIVGWNLNLDGWSPATSDWTIECLGDLVQAINQARMSKKVTYPDFPKRDKCFFHVHGKDEHC